jgi:hypothetical protein
MGVYDNLVCHYPLPIPGANEREYQTKDTARQLLHTYDIRQDGTLWCEAYDMEDRGDTGAEGIERFLGMLTRVNLRWVPAEETVVLRFYDSATGDSGWIEWEAVFDKGRMIVPPRLIQYEPPGD